MNPAHVYAPDFRLPLPATRLKVRVVFFCQGSPDLRLALNGKPVRSSRAIPALPPQR